MPDVEHSQAIQRWTTDCRYYRTVAQQNLFGQWEVVRAWGGLGTRLGRVTVRPASCMDEAFAMLETEARRRSARGYRPDRRSL